MMAKLLKLSALLGSLLLVVAFSAMIIVYATAEPPQVNVAQEWNRAVSRLGIEPVYPPQEDIAVGDVVLNVSTASENPELSRKNFLGKSVRIDHIDLTRNIESNYRGVYRFPETAARPVDDAPWPQSASEHSIFDPVEAQKTLPLVAFPEFKITASADLSGATRLTNTVLTALGLTADLRKNSTVEIRIPQAETYGVNAVAATGALNRYCASESTRAFCMEKFARRQLSMIVGDAIYERCPGPKPSQDQASAINKTVPCLRIEIALVSRVFLIRSIDQASGSQSALSLDVRPPTSAAASAGDQPNSAPAVEAAPIRGAVSANMGQDIAMKRTFLRPVVMGFRAVRFDIAESNLESLERSR